MVSVLEFLAVVVVVVLGWLIVRARLLWSKYKGIPGPPPHFLFGNFMTIARKYGRYRSHVMVREGHKEFGKIFVLFAPFGATAIIFSRDPVLSRTILKSQEDFPGRNREGRGFGQFIPQGLLGDIKGDVWRLHRRTLSPLFSDRYLRWYTTAVNEQLTELIAYFRERQNTDVDVHAALTAFTLDVIGRVGFGTRFKALGDPDNKFIGAGKDILAGVVGSTTIPIWFTPRVYKKAKEGEHTFDLIVNAVLDNKSEDSDDAKLNMLRAMQEAEDKDTGRKLSRKEIRDEIHTLLGAGHETTANTASWALHLLSRNLHILTRVREEIQQVSKTEQTTTPGLFDFDSLPKLVFTKNVIFETLRLFPTVPMFPRLAANDVTINREDGKPLFIPKGTIVFTDSVQFSEGEIRHPEIFRPERFDPSSPFFDPVVEDKTKFLAFGGGGRVCLGQRFAEMEAVQMVAAVIANFDVNAVPSRPLQEYCDVTLGPKESGLWLHVSARN